MTDTLNAQMADDSAKELVALYPPASTHLQISQETTDAYGIELVSKLRESGYALESGVGFGTPLNSTGSKPAPDTAAPPTTTKSFSYIVDQLGDGLYRVTLRIDTKIVSRVYMLSGSEMVAAGTWTRRE